MKAHEPKTAVTLHAEGPSNRPDSGRPSLPTPLAGQPTSPYPRIADTGDGRSGVR